MANEEFYNAIFPKGFWSEMDRSRLTTDPQSMFGDQEVFDWLIRLTRPEQIIEIGSWKGHSANYMIDRCKREGLNSSIVCVDTFLGGPEHWTMPGSIETLHREMGRPSTLERFLGNTFDRGNDESVFPLTVDSVTGASILKHYGFKADLIFVDGAHDPAPVRADVMSYYSLLSEKGVMFGDDYQYPPLAETVHQCARELNLKVLVYLRKWILLNEAMVKQMAHPQIQLRDGFEGWVHP